MKELETLLNRRWILKSEDKELYYKIRDAVGEIRKYSTDKLGCQIIDNSLLVKMEKIPVVVSYRITCNNGNQRTLINP